MNHLFLEQREKLNITQGEAGFQTNIDEKNFSQHEQGTRTPKLRGLYKLRSKLDISIDLLINDTITIVEEENDGQEE